MATRLADEVFLGEARGLARLVLLAVAFAADDETRSAVLSTERIAELVGAPTHRVDRALAALVAAGALRRTAPDGWCLPARGEG